MVRCELDLTSIFFLGTFNAYEIDLPPSVKKIGFSLLDDEDFTISYNIIKNPNSSTSHKLQHNLRRICGSLLLMGDIRPQKRGHLMNSSAIIINMVNSMSRSVYFKEIYTSRYILKNFGPYLIKLDLWFCILNFVSHKIL